jgi:integrase
MATKNRSRLVYPFLDTLAWAGMRSDDTRTLGWSQVNLQGGEIVAGKSKTEAGKGRRIPMSANLKAVLSTHASACAGILGELHMKAAWEAVREAAKVDCQQLHDLRHSFCAKLAEADVPESTMLDMMGHVSMVVLRRYSHKRAQARRDAIDALESRQLSNEVPKVSPTVSDSANKK